MKDTRAKLPNTGGAGTLVFTIVGGSLIVAAGILLAIVLKKRASK
ncbi:MAG: LPXTG cell wall anchor domain-containing protein [Ruminococcus sp.]|nr:LPXTG cell wall anchor domain-containing protein [Ruminococcus sp.]